MPGNGFYVDITTIRLSQPNTGYLSLMIESPIPTLNPHKLATWSTLQNGLLKAQQSRISECFNCDPNRIYPAVMVEAAGLDNPCGDC